MQWFKHNAHSHTEYKLYKALKKYSSDAYAVYFICLELITEGISKKNSTFELEHDAEFIADKLFIKGTATQSGAERVSEIMLYLVDLGLFDENCNRIYCPWLRSTIDSSMISDQEWRKTLQNEKKRQELGSHDNVMISHDSIMQDKIRLDKDNIRSDEEEIRKDSSLSACADEEKKTQDYDINNIDPITNNPYSFINYMYNRIEEEHNKLTPQDPYKRNEDFFIRKLYDTIDKPTFDGKLNSLITRIKNTKNKEFLLTLSAKTLLNKLNDLQIAVEPPKVNNRYKSGNVKSPIRSMTLREQILSTPGLADKYCLADVYEDEIEKGYTEPSGKKLGCYGEL